MTLAGHVRLVCTDRGTHPSRELAIMSHRGDDPELLEALLESPEFTEAEARTVYEWDALGYGDWLRKRDRKGAAPVGPRRKITDPQARADEESGPRWRFPCPTCRRDIQMTHGTALKLVEGALNLGEHRIDLSYFC